MSDLITVYAPGHLDPYDSYGLIGCELVRHLTKSGMYVNAIALGKNVHPNQDEELQEFASRPIRMASGGILLGYPTLFPKFGALSEVGSRVAISMFESTKIPTAWAENFNKTNAVIVPTEFCKKIFIDCGVTVSVVTIPLGVRPVYQSKERSGSNPFKFLTFMDRGKRKGGFFAVDAFVKAFGNRDDVKLVVKTRAAKTGYSLEFENPNIDVVQEDLTEQELCDLYTSCHCLLNPNMGEGFGLIPREFAATGGISLVTDWGGTAEDVKSWGWSLPYRLIKADWQGYTNLEGQDLGEWAEPDTDGIAYILRDVVENRSYYQAEALQRSTDIPKMYSWKTFSDRVYDVWRYYAN